MLKRQTGAAAILAVLLLTAGATGCGSTQASSPPGQHPITSGVVTPRAITRPHAGPTDAPAAPGTAILLQDRTASYTPAGATLASPYQPIDPAQPHLTVALGTKIELRLAPSVFQPPHSSDPRVLRLTDTWHFIAAEPGTSVLSATPHPCSGVETACNSPYEIAIVVTGPTG